MKYVILIHANPDPWGHPTSIYTAEGRALPAEQRYLNTRAAPREPAPLASAAPEHHPS